MSDAQSVLCVLRGHQEALLHQLPAAETLQEWRCAVPIAESQFVGARVRQRLSPLDGFAARMLIMPLLCCCLQACTVCKQIKGQSDVYQPALCQLIQC